MDHILENTGMFMQKKKERETVTDRNSLFQTNPGMTYNVKLRIFDTRFIGPMHKLQHPHQLLAFGSFADCNLL